MKRGDESGFTLMEMLVALVIMVAVAAMLYRGLSSGLKVSALTANAENALSVARARLAGLGYDTPLEAGRSEGRDGGVVWELTVQPYVPPHEADRAARMNAFWATVTVFWRDRRNAPQRSLQLTTLKLAAAR